MWTTAPLLLLVVSFLVYPVSLVLAPIGLAVCTSCLCVSPLVVVWVEFVATCTEDIITILCTFARGKVIDSVVVMSTHKLPNPILGI